MGFLTDLYNKGKGKVNEAKKDVVDFYNKKVDPVVDRVAPVIISIPRKVTAPVAKKAQMVFNPPSTKVTPVSVIKEVPKSATKVAKSVGNFAVDVAQAGNRQMGNLALDVAGVNTYKPTSRVEKILLGDRELTATSVQLARNVKKAQELNQQLEERTGVSLPKPLAGIAGFGGTVASTVLDIVPGGGSITKKTVAQLAKAKTAAEVLKVTKKLGVADDIAATVAETLAKTSDEKVVEKILKQVVEVQRNTAPAKIAGVADEAIKSGKLPVNVNKDSTFNRIFNPIKNTDATTQKIYQGFSRDLLTASEKATSIRNTFQKKLNIPKELGLPTILKYESGELVDDVAKNIRGVFAGMYKDAKTKLGIDIGFRKNYVPQVYNNSREEVTIAMAKYMKSQGVDPQIIDDYVQGVADIPARVAKDLNITPSFAHERAFPDYKTAMEFGLTPKFTDPSDLIAYYKEGLETAVSNKKFLDNLMATGKISKKDPGGWVPLNTPFAKGMFAEPRLAETLNNLFRDEADLSPGSLFWKYAGKASKIAQEVALSAGVPGSTANFFAGGQVIKDLTSFDPKTISTFIRSNFNGPTRKFFENNADTVAKMAQRGLDITNRTGSFNDVYRDLASNAKVTQKVGQVFGKAFNRKTFGNFMPMRYVDTFKEAEKRAIKKYKMDPEAAADFAADATKNFYGLIEDWGRSPGVKDAMAATLFAPRFRESLVNMIFNTIKSGTTEFNNPAFYKNRRFLAGAIGSYLMYNAVNHKMTGHYMWDNESGRTDHMEIPLPNGDIIHIPFLPSVGAFPRNMIQGGIALATGDFDTAKQKFGSLASMPLSLATELWANKDYFGRQIYDPNDSGLKQAGDIALYVGLDINHPFIRETVKQLFTDKDKPLMQSLTEALEVPVKWSSKSKQNDKQWYEALDRQQKIRKEARDRMQPTLDEVRKLAEEGREEEAMEIVNRLSDDEYEIYKTMRSAEKSQKTLEMQRQMFPLVKQVEELVKAGKEDEAWEIVNSLTDDEYDAYQSAKKKTKGELETSMGEDGGFNLNALLGVKTAQARGLDGEEGGDRSWDGQHYPLGNDGAYMANGTIYKPNIVYTGLAGGLETKMDRYASAAIKSVPVKSQKAAQQNIPYIVEALDKEGILTPQTLAYALATIEHETDRKFAPIEEYGGVKQAAKLGYGGGTNYYGRGFIQLTHDYNYKEMGKRLGLGDKLYKNPKLALDPEISAQILAAFFKDRGVTKYTEKGNFVGARKPVNGSDDAAAIAKRAQYYLQALE